MTASLYMSISNLFAPNPYTIYAKNFVPSGGSGTPGAVAFFDGGGAIASANITVTGANNDLTFDNNTTLFVDNVQSTDGDLNLGGGVTNLLTMNSSNQVTIDATNNITIGHVNSTVDVLDYINVFGINTTQLESLTTLVIGSGTTDVSLDALNNLTIGHAGGVVTLLDTVAVDHLSVLDINSPTTLTIGATTPTTIVDAATTLTVGHVGSGAITIHDSVSTGSVKSPGILTLDAVAAVVIGNTTATSVSIASGGIVTTIQGRADCLGGVRSNFVESATGGAMVIGNAAAGLGLTPSSGVIRVDQLSAPAAINIGNITASAVNLGHVGINATAKGDFVLDNTLLFNQVGATALGFYSEAVFPSVTATGPDASQIVGNLAVQKLGNTVSISFDWTVAPIVTVPASAILTFDVALPAIYWPANLQRFICGVNVNAGYAQGKFSISAAGVMTMYPAAGAWLITEGASSDSVCVSYNTAI